MAAIDQDLSDEFFKYVQFMRDTLPVLEATVELLFPALVPEIDAIKIGQTALFELISRLQSAPPVNLDDAKERMRQETLAVWRAGRG